MPEAVRGFGRLFGHALVWFGSLCVVVAGICLSVHITNNRYLLNVTSFIFDRPGDDETRAKQLVHFVATSGGQPVDPDSASLTARLEHALPLELSPVTVLRDGFAFPDARRFGSCGQLARTVRAVAWLRHIRSHKVPMVALYFDGAYRLFDPAYDFYWINRSGHVASIEEVRGDPEIFAQIHRVVPEYPYDLGDASYIRWSRLGRPGARIKSTLTALMGRSWVENLDTPKLYDRPWWGYMWTSLVAAAVSLTTGLSLIGRRSPQGSR